MTLSAPSCQQESATPRNNIGFQLMLDPNYLDSPGAKALNLAIGPGASVIPIAIWSFVGRKKDPSGELQIRKKDLPSFYGARISESDLDTAWGILTDEHLGFLRHVEGDTYYCRGWKDRNKRYFSDKERKLAYYHETKNRTTSALVARKVGVDLDLISDHDPEREVCRSYKSSQTGVGSPGIEPTPPTQSLPPPEISPVRPPQTEAATPTSTDPPKPLQGEIGPSIQAPSKENGLPEMNSLGQLLSQSEVTEQTELTELRDTPPPGVDARPAADSAYYKPGASSVVRFLMSRGSPCGLDSVEVAELNTLRPTEHEMVEAYGAATAGGKFERGLFFARLRVPKTAAGPTPASKPEPAKKNALTTPRQIKPERVLARERRIGAEESTTGAAHARAIAASIL